MAAAVIIGALGYKVLFEKPSEPAHTYVPGQNGNNGNKGKLVSPYHDQQIKNTIMKNRGDIIECYNTFITTNPEMTDGPLKVDFQIDDDGDVLSSEKVSGPFVDETFIQCVTNTITKWKFPEPNIATPVYAEHTFHFKRREETKK